jgi:high-affinity iron transporter
VAIGYAVFQGMVRLNLGTFFTYTGAFLIIVAAGILAYGIHDLQEAAVLPGPFSGMPITPTDLQTGEVLVGLTDGPFWMAAFPFGWAFDLTGVIDPTGVWATVAKATVGFTPLMSWLEVTVWASYLLIVAPKFVAAVRRNRAAARAARTIQPTPDRAPAELSSAPKSTLGAPREQTPEKVLVPERNAL